MSVKASAIDRIIREISPAWAANRLENKAFCDAIQAFSGFGSTSGAYKGVDNSRLRNHFAWNRSRPGSEDFLVGQRDRQDLRLECRDLWRNNEVVRGAVDRFVDYAVWNGIFPQPQTSDTAWNREAQAWWKEIYVPMADNRGIRGVDLITLQKLTISHRAIDGDLGFIFLKNGQIQAIEPDRIETPSDKNKDKQVISGIRTSKSGVILGYYVVPRTNGGPANLNKSRFIPRENFLHCYQPGRIDQLRGIPDLAAALDKLRDYDETDEAIICKIKDDAYQQFKRTTNNPTANNRARGSQVIAQADGKNRQKFEQHEWGQEHILLEGEDLQAFESKTPNSQVVPFLKHQLQAIAASLNISYEILMLIFTEGSFSSQRAALIHNQHTFLTWHGWINRVFNQPLWNWRIAKAMKDGELPQAPIDANGRSEWFQVSWSLPKFDWVDPNRQSLADEKNLDMCTTSVSALNRKAGTELTDVITQKGDDIILAHQQAEKVNKETKLNLTWQDFIRTNQVGQDEARQVLIKESLSE